MFDNKENRHSFINNSLRIEVLLKLVSEKIEQNRNPEEEHIEDLIEAMQKHLDLLALIQKKGA